MNSSALIIMLLAEGTITAITFYFFWLVLKTPSKPEPDSFSGNGERNK